MLFLPQQLLHQLMQAMRLQQYLFSAWQQGLQALLLGKAPAQVSFPFILTTAMVSLLMVCLLQLFLACLLA